MIVRALRQLARAALPGSIAQRLDWFGWKHYCPCCRSMLRMFGNANWPVKNPSSGFAVDLARRANLGQYFSWHIQHVQQLVIPGTGVQVKKHRPRSIARIGHVQRAAGQVPQQPGVNGAEGQFAARGPLPGTRYVIQQPAQLAAGKIRINH